ncbi:hypothetical protein M513_06538 [Trichuris suis]|uniref:Uncharacterized protein n=1 Tax=Trichuris suis TaxID=68888 RepID=A0A085M645_9BILA|nr:hypothetical protein M513_06538 [Trichuris suis]
MDGISMNEPLDLRLISQYSKIMDGISMNEPLDLRLISQYDGTARQSIAEWLEKVELVCKLRGIDNVADVIPFRMRTPTAFRLDLLKPFRHF